MSGNRHRVPAKREERRPKGEFSALRAQNQARGVYFTVGLYEGKRGRVLTNYVQKRLLATVVGRS